MIDKVIGQWLIAVLKALVGIIHARVDALVCNLHAWFI